MAARLLLTLLALLTGLAASGGTAEARVCGAQVGALEAPLAAVRSAAQEQRTSGPTARRDAPGVERSCRKPAWPTVYLPSVQLGPDRARE